MIPQLPTMIQLDSLLQNSSHPVFAVNARRRIVFFNPACEQLTGVPAHRVLDLECRWHGPNESLELAGLAGVLCPPPNVLSGEVSSVQSLLVHADGSRSWHTIHFLPLAAADGGLAAILGRIMPADAEAPSPPAEPPQQSWTRLRQRLWTRFGFDHIVAASHAMQRVLAQVHLASQTMATVLLRGEAGVGKESLARTIHYQSPQRERSFVALDCRGLPAAVLSRQLSEEGLLGAPTHGVAALYLREPAALPRDLQARLDKVMAAATTPRPPRVMAGCTVDLEQACKSGAFLEALCCRLSTMVIDVPPVRERRPDLPLLVQQIVERCNSEGHKQVHRVHADAMALLLAYPWPGNLVELGTVIRQAHARAPAQELQASDLPARLGTEVDLAALPAAAPERPLPLDELLAQAERRLLELALRQAKGNMSKAAARLKITRPRLYRRMQLLGLVDKNKIEMESLAEEEMLPRENP